MATFVTLGEAQADLDRLLALVEAGEEVFIASGGRVIARLVPPAEPTDKTSDAATGPRGPRLEPSEGF